MSAGRRPRDRTSLAGFGDQPDPRSRPRSPGSFSAITVLDRSEPGREAEDGPGHSAPVWNRTSISCASGRRHHQIGFESKIVAGDHQKAMVACPATGIVNYLIVKDHPRPSPELL